MVGNGTRFAMGEDKSLIAQRNSGDNIRIYTMLRVPENWVKTYGAAHPEPSECTQQIINDYYADWSPELIHLVKSTDPESLVLRSIYQMPVGCRWNPIPGVTLIGDAAHLMSPFGGEGANMAMLDAAELAETLATHPYEKWNEAVAEFEKKMQCRAKWAALLTANNLKIFFGKEWIRLVMIYGVGKPLIFLLAGPLLDHMLYDMDTYTSNA
ncbi:FAD binding domain-containing protein [Ditylenchus destructor]|uniref:FAD binding domain-containing protein n=1 Tax=Ditylenchus destructor TaxID=166010 RepID=A0AAD4R1G2_9BILA|nr:FAD binding domain-containing protein [Ditylenchus destructor]